jgi:predicted Zn finger-like uncharacterized protein
VKTCCPQCETIYDVVPEALEPVRGIVRCFNCGNLFDIHASSPPGERLEPYIKADPEFRYGDDNTPVENDAVQPNQEQPKNKTTKLWYILMAFGLILLLAIQISWQKRGLLLQTAPLKTLCKNIDCSTAQQYMPGYFSITERNLVVDPDNSNILHLEISFRNNASYPQDYPVLQINLYDNNEYIVAKRHLKPEQYMVAANAPPKISPREAVNISLSLIDPGTHANGFRINFL